MSYASRFRDDLRRRLLLIATGSGALVPLGAGCSGEVTIEGQSGGAGGAGSSQTSSVQATSQSSATAGTTTATAGPSTSAVTSVAASTTTGTGSECGTGVECFALIGTACPSQVEAPQYFPSPCTDLGCYISSVDSGPTLSGDQCCYAVTETFCGVGRPFMVEGRARIAELDAPMAGVDARRFGWTSEDVRPDVRHLTALERSALAGRWSSDALLEHASVASFARFALDLLSVGAPPELVADAFRAALDEIDHARLCFALSSSYRGAPVGPGRLNVGSSPHIAPDLVTLGVRAFEEGCVGETIAALVAAEQLERSTDPAVRLVLGRIASDEARHAELAWRTVAWTIREGGQAVADSIRSAAASLRAPRASAEDVRPPRLERHGWLAEPARQEVFREGLRDIVLPCAGALLSNHAANSAAR